MIVLNVTRPPVDLADQPSFRLDDWRVQPSRLLLQRREEEKRLEPRVMALLVEFSRRHGEVLSRAHLLDSVWSEVTVGDDALTMAVSKLRRALGPLSEGSGDFIETIPRVGYRLTVTPEVGDLGEQRPEVETARRPPVPSPRSEAAPRDHSSRPTRVGFAAVVLATVVLVTAVLISVVRSTRGPANNTIDSSEPTTELSGAVPPIRHLTADPGLESQASLHPDGSRLVFQASDGLRILDLGTGQQTQLFEGHASTPRWSPTETRIAFVERRIVEGALEIWLSILSESGAPVERVRAIRPSLLVGISWRPDGQSLLWSEWDESLGTHAIREIELESGRETQHTAPTVGPLGDSRPAISPDGRRLAFVRGADHLSYDLWLLDFASRETRQLTHDGRRIWGFTWQPDSNGLIFSSNRSGPFQLWSISTVARAEDDVAEPLWVPVLEGQARFPQLQGDQLVFDAFEVPADIFEIESRPESAPVVEPARLAGIHSKGRDSSPSWSPDGKRLAFGSDRGGSAELWIAENGNTRQVTQLGGALFYEVGWSPDGRALAVRIERRGVMEIHWIDAATGASRQLRTPDHLISGGPVFGPQSERVYVSVRTPGLPEIWSLDVAAEQNPTKWAEGYSIRFAAGNAYLLSATEPELLVRSPEGAWTSVLQGFRPARAGAWTVQGGSVHALHDEQERVVWREWDLETGSSSVRAVVPGSRLENGKLTLQPEGDALLVGFLLPMQSDLRLMRRPN